MAPKEKKSPPAAVVEHGGAAPPTAVAIVVAAAVGHNATKQDGDSGKLGEIRVVSRKDLAARRVRVRLQGSKEPISGCISTCVALAKKFGVLAPQESTEGEGSRADQWVEFALTELRLNQDSGSSKAEDFAEALRSLDRALMLKTFAAGGTGPTVADVALFCGILGDGVLPGGSASVRGAAADDQGKGPLATQYPSVFRWVRTLGLFPPFAQVLGGAAQAVNSGGAKNTFTGETGLNLGKAGSFDKLALPGAVDGEVCTRFPPEPSGFMHIGHAKAALLNNFYATKYHGKLRVRFDDTNPTKEKQDFVDSILEDVRVLGFKNFIVSYTSDHFDVLERYMEQMISDGNAYVDTTDADTIRDERGRGVESKCRGQSVEENLRLWAEMKKGSSEGVQCVVRAKQNMQDKNKCMRDANMYRCVADTPHHRTGDKYKVYALYDFACPIVDSIEGVTHALRSAEYNDRSPLYDWVCDTLKLRKPYITTFARMNFSYTLLSKRKLQWFVDNGYVESWQDARFPTIKGLLRRGLELPALRDFVLSLGASKNENLMDIEKLWAVNKKFLDPRTPRYTAVAADDTCVMELVNYASVMKTEASSYKTVLKHKKNPDLGTKVVTYSANVWLEQFDAAAIADDGDAEVTLMDWGNVKIGKVTRDNDGVVKSIEAQLHLEGSPAQTKKKLTWLPVGKGGDSHVNCELVTFGNLITKSKVEEGDDVEEIRNKDSKRVTHALGDANLRLLEHGDKIQLERRGYFVVDEAHRGNASTMVLFEIPDGRSSGKGASKLAAGSAAEQEAARQRRTKSAGKTEKKN